jgi:HEPN domain-containing protein|tara:strand:- start:1466 stop:1669 length:204 start_codon:yes stop_codon:yes gene_type:complete
MNISNETFLELSAEIAEAWMNDAYLDDIYVEDENGDERYTEEAQDRFNDILDEVQAILEGYVRGVTA